MPAFLFPENQQATGMSCTLCQGAREAPRQSGSQPGDTVQAQSGPWTVPGVLWSSWRPGEWNPTGALAEGIQSPPRDAYHTLGGSAAWGKVRGVLLAPGEATE